MGHRGSQPVLFDLAVAIRAAPRVFSCFSPTLSAQLGTRGTGSGDQGAVPAASARAHREATARRRAVRGGGGSCCAPPARRASQARGRHKPPSGEHGEGPRARASPAPQPPKARRRDRPPSGEHGGGPLSSSLSSPLPKQGRALRDYGQSKGGFSAAATRVLQAQKKGWCSRRPSGARAEAAA